LSNCQIVFITEVWLQSLSKYDYLVYRSIKFVFCIHCQIVKLSNCRIVFITEVWLQSLSKYGYWVYRSIKFVFCIHCQFVELSNCIHYRSMFTELVEVSNL